MFRNAWNLGTISGIKIRLHWSFLLLPIYVYYSTVAAGQTAALTSVALVLAIFGCVLLHELGHAFAARQFGIGTRDIILLPIGGVASLERMPRNPLQELWIAVAGPLVNVVIAIAIFLGIQFAVNPAATAVTMFLAHLAIANVILVVFNMIPAFPMDGGRVFRSILAIFLPYAKATTIAATVGKFCAIALGLYGLMNFQFVLILLAGFVYLAGQAELMQVLHGQRRRSFRQSNQPSSFGFRQQQPSGSSNYQYGQKEISVPSTLSGDSVAAWLANMHAECCSIVESGRVVGRMTKSQLLTALSQGFGSMPIGQILMQKQQ